MRPLFRSSRAFALLLLSGLLVAAIAPLRAAVRPAVAAAPIPVTAAADSAAVAAAPVAADSLGGGRPVLLFFTASWCGPCRMVRQRTFADGEVAALLGRFEVRMIDIDLAASAPWRARYASPRSGVPELVLLDRRGRKIASLAGYRRDPRETADFLRQALPAGDAGDLDVSDDPGAPAEPAAPAASAAASAPAPSSAAPAARRAGTPFVTRLFYSPWSLCFEAGPAFSRIVGSGFDGFRTGFYLAAAVNRLCARRWQVEAGLELRAAGGRSAAGALRSYRLVLPAEAQYRLWRGLHAAAGLYGACRVGSRPVGGVDAGRWDAGVGVRLLYEAGSFRLSCGYRRGLVLQPAGGRCESLSLGAALMLGK